MPATIQPAITSSPGINPAYPNPYQMMSMLYGESGGQTNRPETLPGQRVDDLQHARGNVILNRIDQSIDHPNKGVYQTDRGVNGRSDYPGGPKTGHDEMTLRQWNDMYGHLLAGNTDIYNSWMRALGTGLDVLGRAAPPLTGAGSGIMFNGRSTASQADNVEVSPSGKIYVRPFVGTMGPYNNGNGYPYTAFFGKPK